MGGALSGGALCMRDVLFKFHELDALFTYSVGGAHGARRHAMPFGIGRPASNYRFAVKDMPLEILQQRLL